MTTVVAANMHGQVRVCKHNMLVVITTKSIISAIMMMMMMSILRTWWTVSFLLIMISDLDCSDLCRMCACLIVYWLRWELRTDASVHRLWWWKIAALWVHLRRMVKLLRLWLILGVAILILSVGVYRLLMLLRWKTLRWLTLWLTLWLRLESLVRKSLVVVARWIWRFHKL